MPKYFLLRRKDRGERESRLRHYGILEHQGRLTPKVSRGLNLMPIDRIRVAGINNVSMADVVEVSIGLPNMVMVEDINVMICDLKQNIDLLIGMNIILLGDFSISNGGGSTLFSFVMPPFENKTDHYEKTLAVNKRNKL